MVEIVREKPRPGDWIRQAYWYNADDPKRKEEAEDKVSTAIFEMAVGFNVATKPIQWEHVTPDSPQVPPPPKRMQGNLKCAIGSAEVVTRFVLGPQMTDTLEPPDLDRLRAATRRAHRTAGGGGLLTNEECDDRINELAPSVAARHL